LLYFRLLFGVDGQGRSHGGVNDDPFDGHTDEEYDLVLN
jgi:hypothetical protein